jgi:hypothetical protein
MVQTRKMPTSRRRGATRKSVTKLRITKQDGSLYVGGSLQKAGWWITVSKSLLYVSRNGGRSYWVLSKVRPPMHFSDRNQSVTVGSNRLVLHSPTTYERVKAMLALR